MNSNYLILNLYALIIIIILSISFFGKKRLHKVEDNLYGALLIVAISTIIFGLLLGWLVNNKAYNMIIIYNKFYLFGLIMTLSIFAFYTFSISIWYKENSKLSLKFYLIFCVINLIAIFILPLKIKYNENVVVTSGLAIKYTIVIFMLVYLILIFLLLLNFKDIKNKKYIPIILLVLEGIGMVIIQELYPNLNYIINPSIVVTCLIMYFTIENPDMKMLEEVILAKNTAEKANKVKSEFLSSMSHEIRTPMNAIMGCTDILESEDNLSNDGKEILSELKNATNNLLDICSGILNVSQIESGDLEIKVCEYNPVDTFNDLYKLIKNRVKDNVTFRTDFSSDIPEILHGDKDKIKEIIINLLTNATKYTDNGEICFKVDSNIKDNICNLTITISDTGKGISEELIDKIFDNFVRDESVKNSSTLGLGLGLSIARSLVNLMDGKINVKSQVGKGTEFVVVIPQKLN